jgi:MHS family proline/betaine transporter-like MFS transporter
MAADVGTAERRRAVLAISAGNFVEGYDLALYGYFAVYLAGQFFPPGNPTAALLSTFAIYALGLVVRPVGGVLFGHLGDRIGRRPALITAMLMMAVATAGVGLLPTYRTAGLLAPVLLLVCRVLQGLSIAGELVGANVLILEYARARSAGRSVAVNQLAGSLGVATAATGGLLLAQTLGKETLAAWGWRLPFLAAALFAMVILYLRLRVSDSPVFRAAADVRRARFPLGSALRTARRGIVVYTAWTAMVALGGYMLFGFMPTYLARFVGLSPTGAFAANLVSVLTLGAGATLGGYLVDRFSARRVALISAIGVAVTVLPGFLLIREGTVPAAIAGQVVWAVFLSMGSTVGAVLSLSQFPAPVRYTGTGFSYNIAYALFGGTAPYVSTWLVTSTGSLLAPAFYLAVVAIAGGLPTAWFGLRSTDRHETRDGAVRSGHGSG